MSGSLPEPIAQGDLTRTPFAHVLMHLRRHELTGSLVLWDPDATEGPKQDRIRFEAGKPTSALLRERASRLDRSLLPLFARDRGPYAFYPDVDLVGDSPHARSGEVEVLPLIAASLRGSSRDDVVEHVVGKLGDQPLRVVSGVNVADFGLLPKELGCIELLRAEPVSVAKLQSLSQLGPVQVSRLIYLFAIAKAVEVWDASAHASAVAARRPVPRPRESVPSEETAAAGGANEATAKKAKGRSIAPGAPDALPPMPSGLSPEHQALWMEIAARADSIENENYFIMLNVPRDVSAAGVQKAYFALVKKWHPDRVPAPLAALRPTVERIFGYLTRAQETLGDEEKRGPYLQNVQAGGGTPEADRQLALIIGAAMEFRKVEILLRRSEWDEALAILDEILQHNEDEPDYHATRAWVLYQKHAAAEAIVPTVIAGLERAIETAPKHDKAHYWLGLVLKRANQTKKALQHFELAAQANPRNFEAVREVRLAKMRKSEAPPSEKSGTTDKNKKGLLEKLFGGKK
ncbi:MAG: DnaJ domain-containing protein [Sandaracinaceae bacterium]|nr:DnaJ domain-containing protein [Sandaracinaceae bacterium]